MNSPKAPIQTGGIENRKPIEIQESPEITEKALPKSVDTREFVPEKHKCRFCDYKEDAKELEDDRVKQLEVDNEKLNNVSKCNIYIYTYKLYIYIYRILYIYIYI